MNTTTLRMAVVRLGAVAVLAGGSVGITASTVSAEDADKKPDAQAMTTDIELTPKQAHRLRHLWTAGRHLSPRQALDVVGLTPAALVPARAHDAATTAPDGQAESTGKCSTMVLWGDADGNWVWSNRFYPRSVGGALFGRGSVTTNAIAASYDTFDIIGLQQIKDDKLSSAGFFPTATEVRAWSFNIDLAGNPHLCYGQLSAWYD